MIKWVSILICCPNPTKPCPKIHHAMFFKTNWHLNSTAFFTRNVFKCNIPTLLKWKIIQKYWENLWYSVAQWRSFRLHALRNNLENTVYSNVHNVKKLTERIEKHHRGFTDLDHFEQFSYICYFTFFIFPIFCYLFDYTEILQGKILSSCSISITSNVNFQ